MARLFSLAALFVALGFIVVGCTASSQSSAPPVNSSWLADADTGCKFAVRWLKPTGNEGGVWRFESAQTAKWIGGCADGLASGVGTAIVSVRPVMPNVDPGSGKSFSDPAYAHQPPYENLFYGNFDAGRPNGAFVIRYSNGLSAIEFFDHGVVREDPVVHFEGARNEWSTLPLDQLERMVTRDFASGRVRPRPIDPRQGADAGSGNGNGSIKVKRLLDVSRYADTVSFKASLDHEFPRFSRSPELLNHLIWLSERDLGSIYFEGEMRAGCRHGLSLLVSEQSAWHCVYSTQKNANTKIRETWVYATVFSNNATLMYYELHRYITPDDFVSRGIPLRVENFLLSKDFISAAMQVLGPTPTMEQVAQLMGRAGMMASQATNRAVPQANAVPLRTQPVPGGPSVTTTSPPTPPIRVRFADARLNGGERLGDGEGRAFSALLTGCSWATAVEFEFDPVTKVLIRATPDDVQGCL